MQLSLQPNALRFRAQTGSRRRARQRPGHVESYFVRANHPTRRLALWLKATLLAAPGDDPVAEVWAIVFDGDRGRVWAAKRTVPFSRVSFGEPSRGIEVAGTRFRFAAAGDAVGSLEHAEQGRLGWDVSWRAVDSELGRPLCLLPVQAMIDGPFPRSKLLTPFPLLRMQGHIEVWGERIEISDWSGMQGHNWGRELAWEYAWGQYHFSDAAGVPFCWVEGFSGRIRLAGLVTPMLSALVVRRHDREYRFDRIFDTWRQDAQIDDLRWTLSMRGPGGEAWLEMQARPDETVCLGYQNPDHRVSHCLNSKLARVKLRVNPYNEEGFSCTSEHGGALEFLRNEADPRFQVV